MTTSNNEPAEQLLAVLDILWDEMQWRTMGEDDEVPAPPSEDELNTALWQVHEMVFAMSAELDRAYDLLERLVEDRKQRESVRSVLFGADGKLL